jgi:outer membrane lipoprotein-sorting protein
MTEDQNQPSRLDRRQGDDLRKLRSEPAPVPGAEQSADADLRELFRVSAPSARPVDVEALFSAAQTCQPDQRRLAWSRLIGRSRDVFHDSANPSRRRRTMLMTMKIAAAAAALLTVGGLFYFAVVPSMEATAFAEVAQKLRDSHTLAYRVTVQSPDLKTPLTMRVVFKEPKLMRAETDGGIVTIVDGSQGKQLLLDPAAKTAMLLERKDPDAARVPTAVGLIENLRQLAAGDAKPAGRKLIGEIQAHGYLVKAFGIEMTVWVDPGTRLPIRVELTDGIQGKETRVTLFDIQVDPDLDDALFRVAAPPGYALRKSESNALEMDEKTLFDPAQATAAFLRIFAEKTGGTFPRRLDDLTEFDAVFPKKQKIGELPDAEALRFIQTGARFMMATRSLKQGFGYRSEGVKLGDADKILFWYRPDGAADYRVIYGDLHISDVTGDKLPEKPKT